MELTDIENQESLTLVARAIAKAMGHEERWRTYISVARMHLAGYEACKQIDALKAYVPVERKRRR